MLACQHTSTVCTAGSAQWDSNLSYHLDLETYHPAAGARSRSPQLRLPDSAPLPRWLSVGHFQTGCASYVDFHERNAALVHLASQNETRRCILFLVLKLIQRSQGLNETTSLAASFVSPVDKGK